MDKPELGPVAVGDHLLVLPRSYGRGSRPEPIDAVVTKIGRVWIDLESTAPRPVNARAQTWRMRLDTQSDAGPKEQQQYATTYVTAEQYAWSQRNAAVEAYLREVKVRLDYESPWNEPKRRIVLTNLLRAHDGLDPL